MLERGIWRDKNLGLWPLQFGFRTNHLFLWSKSCYHQQYTDTQYICRHTGIPGHTLHIHTNMLDPVTLVGTMWCLGTYFLFRYHVLSECPGFSLIDFLSEDPLPQVDPRDRSEHPVQVQITRSIKFQPRLASSIMPLRESPSTLAHPPYFLVSSSVLGIL